MRGNGEGVVCVCLCVCVRSYCEWGVGEWRKGNEKGE